jgi:hypothetical protein
VIREAAFPNAFSAGRPLLSATLQQRVPLSVSNHRDRRNDHQQAIAPIQSGWGIWPEPRAEQHHFRNGSASRTCTETNLVAEKMALKTKIEQTIKMQQAFTINKQSEKALELIDEN